ncbi:MAG TPA: metal ABC transporter permease [Sporichthyaceae bacterium]|nr:metal ABC transporter permease [Sporichthyaceae bacterium]
MPEVLAPAFMQRALLAALAVGLAAPAIGIYLVQRRLALLGDGIGHTALLGVALAALLGTASIPTAAVVAVIGAVIIEVVRTQGRTSGDVALALLFYGGIAGGVLLFSLAPAGSATRLTSYLFGQITTVAPHELGAILALAAVILVLTIGLAPRLFAVCHDEEFARVSGLPVTALNIGIAALAALTVTISMRVVGVLMVSALMVVPVATAQLITRSFRATFALAISLGTVAALSGVVVSYYADVPSGPSIVVLAIGGFAVTATGLALTGVVRRRSVRNEVMA